MILLTTVEDCDKILEIAQEEKSDLEYRKTSLERRHDSYSGRAVQVAADLQAVTTEIGSLETVITSLPDGDVKDDMEKRKVRLDYRKFLLESRSENYGTIALLEQEMNVGRIDQELAEVDAFIAEVNTHKATL